MTDIYKSQYRSVLFLLIFLFNTLSVLSCSSRTAPYLEDKIDYLNRDNSDLSREIAELRNQLSISEGKVIRLEKENGIMMKEKENFQNKIVELEKRLKIISDENQRIMLTPKGAIEREYRLYKERAKEDFTVCKQNIENSKQEYRERAKESLAIWNQNVENLKQAHDAHGKDQYRRGFNEGKLYVLESIRIVGMPSSETTGSGWFSKSTRHLYTFLVAVGDGPHNSSTLITVETAKQEREIHEVIKTIEAVRKVLLPR